MGGDDDADDGPRRQHHGAVRDRVRRDGREEQHLHARLDDRPTHRERVGGRAGRRGDDDAVGAIRRQREPVDRDGELHDARPRPVGDDHVVDGAEALHHAAVALEASGDRHAPIELVVAGDDAAEHRHRFALDHLGEKAELTQVHPEDGDAGARAPRDREERPVSPEDDDEVTLPRQLVLRPGRRSAETRFDVEQHPEPATTEPGDHPPREARRAGAVPLHDQPDRPDARHHHPSTAVLSYHAGYAGARQRALC